MTETNDTYDKLADDILCIVHAFSDSRRDDVRALAARVRALGEKYNTEAVLLRNMLAVIHRDGGHHTEEVGLVPSCSDALDEVYKLRTLVDDLHVKVADAEDEASRLRAVLQKLAGI